jgi:hypothetical protein
MGRGMTGTEFAMALSTIPMLKTPFDVGQIPASIPRFYSNDHPSALV